MQLQDTMVALEALAEYDVKKPSEPFRGVQAEFFVTGRSDRLMASLSKPTDRVEVELKVRKTFHLLEPKHTCTSLNINVDPEGYCVSFDTNQTVAISLLQPAPASFYDYYEPTKDRTVKENSVRVFAKRLQCRAQLEQGKQYLIMGKDGSTTDSQGQMQYLLESNTWVELVPEENK
ncbi:hypothetical protein CRUP_001348 [Coryphaenoides rupestris]|nr:hypothetical protein CRUP_001348 [Coryphaenoides rupestris]